jgi:hypothetical protein
LLFGLGLIDERDILYEELWVLCERLLFNAAHNSQEAADIAVIGKLNRRKKKAMFDASPLQVYDAAKHAGIHRAMNVIHGTVGDFDDITAEDDGGLTADDRVTAPVDVDAMSENALREMVRAQQGIIKKLKSWKYNLRTYFPNSKDDGFKLGRAIRDLSNFEFHVRNELGGYEDTELYKEIERLKNCSKQNRDLLDFVSKMQTVIDRESHPNPDEMVKATKAMFEFSNFVCSALECTEDTFLAKLQHLQHEKKMFEIEIAAAFAPLETHHPCTTFMEKIPLLSSSMQQIKLVVPCEFIDKAPEKIHELHQQIEKLKGAPIRMHGLSSADAVVAKMEDDIASMTGELQNLSADHHMLQAKLLEARQDYLREHELATANAIKVGQLELICKKATEELDRVTNELKRISVTNVDAIVLTTRTAYLLGELHKLIDANFARVSELDIVVLIDRIANVICSAFYGIDKCRAVRGLMYTLMVRLQLDFQSRDVDDGVTMARFVITQLKEHGDDIVKNPEKYDKLIEEQLNKLQGVRDASKKRLENMFKVYKDIRSKYVHKHEGEPEGEDESESEVEGGLELTSRGHSRSERKPPGKHEGERVDGHKSEFQVYPRGPSGSGRTNIPSANAHIECVNNWLRDLSQIV